MGVIMGYTNGSLRHRKTPLRLAYIIGTYPSLTTTFIDREDGSCRSTMLPRQSSPFVVRLDSCRPSNIASKERDLSTTS